MRGSSAGSPCVQCSLKQCSTLCSGSGPITITPWTFKTPQDWAGGKGSSSVWECPALIQNQLAFNPSAVPQSSLLSAAESSPLAATDSSPPGCPISNLPAAAKSSSPAAPTSSPLAAAHSSSPAVPQSSPPSAATTSPPVTPKSSSPATPRSWSP